MDKQAILNAGRDRLLAVLEGSGFQLTPREVEAPRVDAIWLVQSDCGESRLVVEVKRTIWPRDVERVATQLQGSADELAADRCLIVAPSLTQRTRELLTRWGISFVDLRGNIRLAIPGRVLVATERGENASAADLSPGSDRIINPFRGKSSRLVRALLAEPRRWWGVTEMAKAVDVSAGLSVKTLKTLEEEAYIRRDEKRQVRVADGEPLLRRWAEVAGNAFRTASRFTSPIRSPDELTASLARELERLGVGYAVTRLAAARFIEPYSPARVVEAYVEGDPAQFAQELGLLPVERGESVRLVRPPDAGALQFTQVSEGVKLVSPVQLFVDLTNGGGRESDVAERLFENQLRQGFGPAQKE